MKKKGILIAIIILAIGFATVSTTLIIGGTIGIGADVDDYDIIFTSAKIGTVDQTIKKTNKTADTIEFDVLLNKVGEEKVLNYTVKNNSTQYEANANMKCYAINDTDEFMTKYITISGELAGKTLTFAQVAGDAVLSDEINFKAQESKNGTITMALKKSYAGDDEVSVTLKCEIITNADSSDEVVDKVIPIVLSNPGLYDASNNLLCEWNACGINITNDYLQVNIKNSPAHLKNVIANNYPTATKVVIPGNISRIGNNSIRDCKTLTDVIILSGVTTISDYAFCGCSNLLNVQIPDGVTSIGSYAFSTCTSLQNINIPDSVTSIGGWVFYQNFELPSVIIPDSVTSLGDAIFNDCRKLTTAKLPSHITKINDYTFFRCGNLKDYEIPSGVTNIGFAAFSSCTSLTNIVIPSGVTTIAQSAFSGCTGVTNINIPSGVTSIGKYAFYNVPHITYYGTASGSPWNALSIN